MQIGIQRAKLLKEVPYYKIGDNIKIKVQSPMKGGIVFSPTIIASDKKGIDMMIKMYIIKLTGKITNSLRK